MARTGFPRAARLLSPADFTAARQSRRRLTTADFVVEYWPAPGTSARLGMAVSRRVSKRAVVRNRIRRQVRESFRTHRERLPGFDILLIARTRAATQDNSALRADLASIWKRLAMHPPLKRNDRDGTMRADP